MFPQKSRRKYVRRKTHLVCVWGGGEGDNYWGTRQDNSTLQGRRLTQERVAYCFLKTLTFSVSRQLFPKITFNLTCRPDIVKDSLRLSSDQWRTLQETLGGASAEGTRLLGGSGGMLPQKRFEIRIAEMAFAAF